MARRRYGRGKFDAHPKYVQYMTTSVAHPSYGGMPNAVSDGGHVNWQVSSGKTTSFNKFYEERFKWWTEKADSLGLPGSGNSHARFSLAARLIHPSGYRPCRLCGKSLNVGYFYLNHLLATRWNELVGREVFHKGQPITEGIAALEKELGPAKLASELQELFPEREELLSGPKAYAEIFEHSNHIPSKYLSPGFMCNPPDRLDGFHDYGICCRKTKDPGRSDENLRSYQHDRRTFRWWAEGNWMIADALYNRAGSGECARCGKSVDKITPDHVGPLACGFRQIPFFRPLCGPCNSSKNRRMSANDVRRLVEHEKAHLTSAASWHVQALWDSHKLRATTDRRAKELSSAMRALEDFYLRTLYELYKARRTRFLVTLLSPQHAFEDVEFDDLSLSAFTFAGVRTRTIVTPLRQSMASRIVRIAFEELRAYASRPVAGRKSAKYFIGPYGSRIQDIVDFASRYALSEVDVRWHKVMSSTMRREQKDKEILDLLMQDPPGGGIGCVEIRNYMKKTFDSMGQDTDLF